jgi:DNA helicase-2/ATP-dependent DNA helicase PcrA
MTEDTKRVNAAKERVLVGLNPRQVEAVTHIEGPLLILAGAGSGKTTVLTRRVAYIIASGWAPSSILAITFTNKAAKELKARIAAFLGDRADGVWALTFHSACARILRTEFPGLGRSGRFSIADDSDQQKIMKACLKELNLSEKQYPPRGILHTISNAKNDLIGPAEYAKSADTFYETKVSQAYSLYKKQLLELDALDFDDLLMETVLMFREHPGVLKKYQDKFQHILVDEYQDTNKVQYELTRLLAASHRRIAVVGDDDQSIYTFRGADIRNILDFERDYPDCRVVKLEENYRSTQVILDGAFNVVRHNIERKDKKLWTSKKGGVPITVYAGQSGEDEARFVAGEIERLAIQGTPLSSCAVLYRTHAQSRSFEEAFVNAGLPYTVLAGFRFYERKHIRDAISYLRLLVYPRDRISLERVISEPPRGLGPAAVDKIVLYAQSQNVGLIDALCDAESIKGLTRPQKKNALDFGKCLREMALAASAMPLGQLLHDLLEKVGYLDALRNQGTSDSESRLEDLSELMASLRAYDESENPLFDYLESCSLTSDQDSYDEKKEACVMGTLHSAKGLEFEVVFLVGMEEGLLPHARATLDERQLEEERRLMYVGMTRAKARLYLTFAFSREGYLGQSRTRVSRFIAEIPRELLEVQTWED